MIPNPTYRVLSENTETGDLSIAIKFSVHKDNDFKFGMVISVQTPIFPCECFQ